jgi:hypothetical protein
MLPLNIKPQTVYSVRRIETGIEDATSSATRFSPEEDQIPAAANSRARAFKQCRSFHLIPLKAYASGSYLLHAIALPGRVPQVAFFLKTCEGESNFSFTPRWPMKLQCHFHSYQAESFRQERLPRSAHDGCKNNHG